MPGQGGHAQNRPVTSNASAVPRSDVRQRGQRSIVGVALIRSVGTGTQRRSKRQRPPGYGASVTSAAPPMSAVPMSHHATMPLGEAGSTASRLAKLWYELGYEYRHMLYLNDCWWRRRESNPRPTVLHHRLYMLSPSIALARWRPGGQGAFGRASFMFRGCRRGRNHRYPVDLALESSPRAPIHRGKQLTLLVRSFRRWQLYRVAAID